MVFVKHKGGGRGGDDISSMDRIWTAEWLTRRPQDALAGCERQDTWYWVRQCVKPPARVLEAGCGLGQWVRFLDDRGYEAHGLDFSHEAIRAGLNAWHGLRLLCGDLRCMPYEDNWFDGIVSLGAIEHDEQGPQAILKEMRRVLAPDGILFCTVPCVNYLRRFGHLQPDDQTPDRTTARRGFPRVHLDAAGVPAHSRRGRVRGAPLGADEPYLPCYGSSREFTVPLCRVAPPPCSVVTVSHGRRYLP